MFEVLYVLRTPAFLTPNDHTTQAVTHLRDVRRRQRLHKATGSPAMKAQLYNSLGFAVLGSVLVLLSSNTVIAMSSSSAPSTECTEAIIADGDCDLGNNTEECGKPRRDPSYGKGRALA